MASQPPVRAPRLAADIARAGLQVLPRPYRGFHPVPRRSVQLVDGAAGKPEPLV